jgi:hypothetical protein
MWTCTINESKMLHDNIPFAQNVMCDVLLTSELPLILTRTRRLALQNCCEVPLEVLLAPLFTRRSRGASNIFYESNVTLQDTCATQSRGN